MALECAAQDQQQLGPIERLLKEIERAELHRLKRVAAISFPGHHDDCRVRPLLADGTDQIETFARFARGRESEVDEKEIRLELQQGQPGICVAGAMDLELPLECPDELVEEQWIVLDDGQFSLGCHPLASRRAAGRRTRTVVP